MLTRDGILFSRVVMTAGLDPEVKCIGCGYCCTSAPCGSAEVIYRDGKYEWCTALVWKDGRYWCELALHDPMYHYMHGCGCGCIAPHNPYWYNR